MNQELKGSREEVSSARGGARPPLGTQPEGRKREEQRRPELGAAAPWLGLGREGEGERERGEVGCEGREERREGRKKKKERVSFFSKSNWLIS